MQIYSEKSYGNWFRQNNKNIQKMFNEEQLVTESVGQYSIWISYWQKKNRKMCVSLGNKTIKLWNEKWTTNCSNKFLIFCLLYPVVFLTEK